MKTINIVGAGLAGGLMACVAKERGHQVRVFDDKDKFSATRASSNLFIRHWLKRFMTKGASEGCDILERLFGGTIDEPFSKALGYAAKVRHIGQRYVCPETMVSVAGKVDCVMDDYLTIEGCSTQFEGPTVVCTGYRAQELVGDQVLVDVKVGQCTFWQGNLDQDASQISMISPHRHQKLYQWAPGVIYYSDSVALKLAAYTKRRDEVVATSLARARKLVGDRTLLEMRVGYRPITPGHDFGRHDRIGEGVWSINGGGKNGLACYAVMAEKVAQEIEEAGVL